MVAADKRGTLIISTAGNFFGVPINDPEVAIEGEAVLEKFLDASSCRTICATPTRTTTDSMCLKLTNEIPTGRNSLVFFKLRSSAVTEENFHDLIHVATTGGPRIGGRALIESLRQVWAPTLQSSGVNAACLKRLEEDILGPKASSSIHEEEHFWKRKRDEAKKSHEKKTAQEAIDLVKSIQTELENAATSREGLIGVEEILETVSGYIDDLWKLDGPAYNEERMKSFLEVVGNEVVRLVQTLLDEIKSTDSRARDEAVATAATVCEKWVNVCERLTGLYWPHQSLHPWKGKSFSHGKCCKFGDRLRQTAEIRAQHRQLTRLLTAGERSALGTDALLQSFDDLRVGLGQEGKDVEWERLKHRFEDSLSPAEEKVTEKLRKQFAAAGNPTVLAAEFQRYVELLKREGLKRALTSERESLLASIGELVDLAQSAPDTVNLLDSPRILQEMLTARAAEMRLDALAKLSKELLADLPGYDEAYSKISLASKDAEKKRQYLVESWVSATKSAIESRELSLGSDSAVVELTGSSMMRVNYDPRLTILVKEARALAGQGVELPREVNDLVERAGALAARARALQQIATFHNTIGDRMVPSQRPLMLATALELSRAVREQSGVVWSDPRAVDAYTNRLQELVKKFAQQNSELAAKHATLRDLVAGLLKGEIINLVSSQAVWKETLRKMRSIVEGVEKEYGNTKAWKLHWDRQLLKVLSVAYRAAMPSLTRRLPEIKVELTFRDNRLQWRPSLEEIRAKLYSGIRRFLAIPTNFRGVGDPADGQFGSLVDRSAYLFGDVYKEAEVVLAAIEEYRLKWIPLAAPAQIDVGTILKGKSPQEWERAFKEAKQWAQEVGKLRGGEVKIWCISIDTGTTRNDLESGTRRYWDRLSSDLRAEASSRLVTVTEFLSMAARELDRRPRNVQEVGIAYEVHTRIERESAAMAEELEAVTGFARVLAAWTREKLDGLSAAHGAWEGLADRLERHRSLVARQLEDAKVNLRHRAVALQDEKERWEAKWTVKPEVADLNWIGTMRERWTTMRQQREALKADCQRLEVDVDDVLAEDEEATRRLEAQLDAEESNCRFQAEFIKELENQTTEEWSVARRRLPRLHDWLDSWESRIKSQSEDPDAEVDRGKDPSLEIETFVGKKIREIRANIELLQILRGDEIAEEHWAELRPLVGITDVTNTRDITLGQLFDCSKMIRDHFERVQEIAKRAIAESGIRQALTELESWETTASLQLVESKDSKNNAILLVGEYGELLARAGELKLILEGAKGASGYERFAARAARCETAMFELEERIKALSTLQRKWVYLEPVYSSGAAPNDSGRWTRADKEFRYLMGEIARDSRVPSLRRLPLPALLNLKDLLDRCQKSLDEFLEEKRSSYPRLYFLSDEDLLELVSGSGSGLDAHLPKLYQGIGSVTIEDGQLRAVLSPEGETLQLPESIDLGEALPQWLRSLENSMRKALSLSLEKCLIDTTPDPSVYPAQVLLLSERIRFTERCESALKEGSIGLKNLVEFLETQRAKFRGLEDAGDRLTALKARGLLLDTVHHLRVARTLLKAVENRENTSWTWSRQLRSYRSSNGPLIRCAGANFPYRFEYQGAAVGLVRTPLTERCFLALTQAMKLGLGGSPTGPAGTGKTESVKALAAILGRPVLVFNCDEGMDAGSMRRILGGLAQAGAWGCFDEFNRLEEETLSAVAMLVRPLQEAVRDSSSSVQLGGQSVRLDPHCCIFITMNPADSDYGGRHKLPDSLARLFRPIGMAHPDRCDIVQALLECEGFLEAPTLARQLVETLDISEKLLFKQPHYDWGLRALRSVLGAIPPDSLDATKLNETERLLVAIRASTLPKLTEEDTTKFVGLLQDVFPKVDHLSSLVDSTSRQDLLAAVKDICDHAGYTDDVVNRCAQLYGQLKNRTGVALVGPPGSGKSLIRKILAEGLNRVGEPVQQFNLFPGAIPKSRLLGKVDPETREWKEGLLSSIVSTGADTSIWIVLNGDVEPSWAEALNSALDDNRLLTLPSGVALRLGSGVRFIFETHKLGGASPATVSRLGVIHLGTTTPSSLLLPSKLETLPSISSGIVSSHLANIVETILKLVGEEKSAAGLTEGALAHLRKSNTQNLVTYALLVSLCGQLGHGESRDDVARFIYQVTDSWCPDPQKPFAVLYNPEIDRLEPFGEAAQSIPSENGTISLSGLVKRALAAILPWLESGHPAIIRGPEGCGKSSLISAALASRSDEIGEASSTVRGSSLYGPEDLITRLKRSCIRLESSANGRTYRPRNGSRLVLVLEDLHLASRDLQELVRQLLQEGGFHEDDLEFASLPITLLCTGDEETKLHPRLEALLATHCLSCPSSKDVISMVELHLKSSLRTTRTTSIDSWISSVAGTMTETLTTITSARDSSFTWSPKDLALWADSLKYYPAVDDVLELTRYLWDAGTRLFFPRLVPKDQSRWVSSMFSRIPELKDTTNDVYVWKGGHIGLTPYGEDDWKSEIENAASRCAREGDPVQAKITPHLMKTVSGLSWALGSGSRGVILTGRPGAGRKTATKLVASASSLRLIDAGPGRARAAVKAAVQAAGVEGEPCLLLLEDHHLREPGLAVLAGAIVSRGELPGLLSAEELDGLVAPLADLSRKEDFSGTLDQYLYYRLRNLLRVVSILESGEVKKDWLIRSGLLRHCILVAEAPGNEWWSSESSLKDLCIRLAEDSSQEASPGLETLVSAHLRAPRQQQAPARFLALLSTWKVLRNQWGEEVDKKLSSLEAGIGKLREAGEHVAKLEDEASKQRQELEVEKGRANAALEQITATMRGATGQRGEMATLKTDTERESAELARRKADIEGELGKVEPLVEQAAQAVAGIGADALAEVRSLRAPPAPVRDVLEGVLRLMGIRDTSWNSMKTFLAKRGVKDEIRTWDARRSTAASLEAVAKLVKERPESFEEKTAKRASVAAAPLAAWVLANLQYGQILEQVAPLEREQRVLAERLSAAEAQLGRLAAGLTSVESRVAQLQEELAEHSRGAAALQLRTEATESSLATARALLRKLDVEHSDWQSQFEGLTGRKTRLDVESAEVASLLVYQDPSRDDKWKRSAIDLLITERERLLWRAQDLPADTASLVGAACSLRGPLVPLFVDPSGVAVKWLKSNIGTRLETARPEDTKFVTSLELAVRFGKPLLIEEIVEMPSLLLPLLRMRSLRLGERTLPAQDGFKLFLATRRDALVDSLPGEADAVLMRITLGAGSRSLAERFIEKVLLTETPELEVQRREALEREEKLSGERDQARLDLLAQLGAARGQDLLQESQNGAQGGGLLSSLEATQEKAKEIAAALEKSRRSHENVSKRAKEHEKLAKFAAHLFKAVRALSNLSPLYVFSAEAFTDIYLEAEAARESLVTADKKEQESLIEKNFVALVLRNCLNSAYRRHRLPLALHIALSLNPVSEVERSLLLEGVSVRKDDTTDDNLPEWVPEERKAAVRSLASTLPQVASRLKAAWVNDVKNIYVDQNLTSFQKTLAVQALRPDHLHTALTKLATELLGVKDLTPPTWSLKTVAEENNGPVLLLLSPGADPGPELEALAAGKSVPCEGFAEVSLGQGQVTQAEMALETACRTGGWILLSNLQLALNWLPRLESLLRSDVCTREKKSSTRIWLTTEECCGFYSGLAGLCRKLAYEPPEGVKRNVARSLQQLQQRRPNSGNVDGNLVLAWIHAVLQERRRFVPQGWIREYEWSEADLEAARELVLVSESSRGSKSGRLDWEPGRGLLDVAVYGGRIQDDYDMRALRSILRDIWSKDIFEGRKKLAGILGVSEASRRDPAREIQRLPDSDSPLEYFGLPANAHRAWERASAESTLLALKGMSSKTGSVSERRSQQKIETKFQRDFKNYLEQRMANLSMDRSEKKAANPVEVFFSDERRLVVRLLNLAKNDVNASKLVNSKTPINWLEEWPHGPREAMQFASALIAKNQALNSLSAGLPERLDLDHLTRPWAFLAALKQHTVRTSGFALEELCLVADWSDHTENNDTKVSLYLDGILISGALIENGMLAELDASAPPVGAVKSCRISYVPETQNDHLKNTLNIPLYADSRRNRLICSLPVGCNGDEMDAWLRRGVILHLRNG
ncbi:cytoplasmic dynein 2 heavy chain 1 [Venturia canescens]|uniref:cytoplasmic dynein 2 heavy chain 1 n=1 Tax=Venturia canescens TaxID=32260 RepID=UPI001C9C061E|nr:cytoplasmic dynein 2 heavy chain 1 [Venturia canescens]